MFNKQWYFDIGGTPLTKVALKAMTPYLTENFGNPESIHEAGQLAKGALEQARRTIAELVGANESEEIIFTSGASESDNLALKGVAFNHLVKTGGKLSKKELIISPIEHPAIRESAFSLRDFGFEVKILPVTKAGVVEGETLAKAIGKQTLLVSVIAGNNQFGTRQDLASLATICRERGVLFHTDASLFFGLYPLKVEKLGVDLATLSSPKIYGPKGVAALYVRKGVELYPQLHGGGQEEGRRSGSHNVPAVMGFAAAAKAAWQGREERKRHDQQLSQYFIKQVQARIVGVVLNGDLRHRLANNVHLSILGVEGEALVLGLNDYGIAASSGSACSSRKLQADPALRALNLTPEEVHGSIRFFWHEWTKKVDIDYLLDKLELVVKRLRRVSAYKVGEGKNE